MESVNQFSAFRIFDYTALQHAGMDSLSQNALANGIDLFQKGNYESAVKEFKRSFALSPYSENAMNARDYMVNAYLKLGDPQNAIKTYKTSIQLYPLRDDLHVKLGNLYFSEKKYGQAEDEYRQAVKKNPSVENYYSLAHAYLGSDKLKDAENLFKKVIQLSPRSGDGQYGLGMTFSKQGRHEEAIDLFKETERLKKDFPDVYVDMGYAYADMGEMEEAQKQYEILKREDSTLASLLSFYMKKAEPPKLIAAHSDNFNLNLSLKTPVYALDQYLKQAGVSKQFTMEFQFNKQMDVQSVQNPLNWRIQRSDGHGVNSYNFGMKIPETEVNIAPIPKFVRYDLDSFTASVVFEIYQNDSANGTIDPSHIKFTFSGKDTFGIEMDPESDQFSRLEGFS